jgi:parallel beta-helix repeat protein
MTAQPRRWRLWRLMFGVPLLLCGLTLALFAFLPPEIDAALPYAEQGGGARQSPSGVSGLQAAFPPLDPVNLRRAALGRLLFYDPLLSVNNDRSCASCHHPDLGFSDGRRLALGAHGDDLRRNSPSLWNVAYVDALFWDGRADSLEAQMLVPLTDAREMGANLDALLAELRAVPAYRRLFAEAYGTADGTDAITLEQVTGAIADFQRTLISRNAPFDRFAAGDFDALTPAQRRGFDVFRSAQTRCFECHTFPTFGSSTFHVLGVPDTDPNAPDLGRAETRRAPDAERAFRSPGLRNVSLTAPYMHNGAFLTLEEVIDFYARGGGADQGIDVDEKLRGFTLTPQQSADLVAFLRSLTDEPPDLIAIPDSVPSGLPVVTRLESPGRVQAQTANAAPPAAPERPPQTIRVEAGGTIQAAVDAALPGDTVIVMPGVYHETVYVDRPRITVRGQVEGDQRPWLDGRGVLSDGFNTTGDDFVLEGFGLRDYIGNGVLTTGAERVVYRDLIIENTGIYGIYPVECTDVLVERVTATGIADAAIYVGQSRGPIIVRDNVVYGNVTGIEIENSTHAEVYNNHIYDNTGGILVFLLPNTPSRVAYNTRIYDNLIENNNHPNFADANAIVSRVPPGTGVFIMSADYTEVFNNVIRGNMTGGVGVTSLYMIFGRDTVFDMGVIPEYNWIHSNTFANNGYDPQGEVRALGLPGADIIWTGEGYSNSFDQPGASMFPPLLPGRDWSDPARRALTRVYGTLVSLVM